MQIIGVGHDEREEKAGRVCATVSQTDGLPFVIRAENKKSNPLERAVLRMAYVNRLEIWDIEKRIDKSKATIYRIKRDGIESIARAM